MQNPDASEADIKVAKILINWTHEDQSNKMFDCLLLANKIDLSLEENGGLDAKDIMFIKELIRGSPLGGSEEDGFKFEGRGDDKIFLYEIVSNRRTGLDVDRFDYLQRDSQAALGKHSKTFEKLTESAIVCTDPKGRLVLAFPEDEVQGVMEVYTTRMSMYNKVYMHRKTLIIVSDSLDSNSVFFLHTAACTAPQLLRDSPKRPPQTRSPAYHNNGGARRLAASRHSKSAAKRSFCPLVLVIRSSAMRSYAFSVLFSFYHASERSFLIEKVSRIVNCVTGKRNAHTKSAGLGRSTSPPCSAARVFLTSVVSRPLTFVHTTITGMHW